MDDKQSEADGGRTVRFRRLYDACYGDVTAYCLRRAGPPDAADAVGETFLVAWRRLDEVPDGVARLWLFGVARRVLANQRRSRQRQDRLPAAIDARTARGSWSDPADDGDAATERLDRVVAALATLTDDDQELLRLLAWERLSHHELAVVLGCSVNAIAIRAHRARARLDDAMARSAVVVPIAGRRASTNDAVKGESRAGHIGVDERLPSEPSSTRERSNDE